MARPELPGAAAPIQPPVSPFRWAARTHFSNLLPKCSFIFRMVVVYWSWNCESCPEIKYFSLFLRTALLFQLIPARGRKLTWRESGTELPNFNLSPQGDGNMSHLVWANITILFQLIPARGRKQIAHVHSINEHEISTYPRKGTETRPLWQPLRTQDQISTYPRKGTET